MHIRYPLNIPGALAKDDKEFYATQKKKKHQSHTKDCYYMEFLLLALCWDPRSTRIVLMYTLCSKQRTELMQKYILWVLSSVYGRIIRREQTVCVQCTQKLHNTACVVFTMNHDRPKYNRNKSHLTINRISTVYYKCWVASAYNWSYTI